MRLPVELPDRQANVHIFYLLYPEPRCATGRWRRYGAGGIMATFHYVPLHSSPHGRTLGVDGPALPVTDRIAATLLRLPLHAELTDADVDRVVEAVRETAS